MALAPSAQLRPIVKGRAWRTECQNAVGVWPDSVRPERSVIVPEIITGRRDAAGGEDFLAGENRRLGVERVEDRLDQDDVGAAVDQARAIARHRRFVRSSNVTARKPGLLTSGDIEAVRLVGPSAPATKRRPAVELLALAARRGGRGARRRG